MYHLHEGICFHCNIDTISEPVIHENIFYSQKSENIEKIDAFLQVFR